MRMMVAKIAPEKYGILSKICHTLVKSVEEDEQKAR